MKAASLFGPRDLRVVDAEVPVPGPDDVLVRIARFSPYGTDVDVYVGDPRLPQPAYPMGIGADLAGSIAGLGANVRDFAVGDRVSAAALAHCGQCAQCLRGRTNRCLDPRYLNPPRQVACQEYALVHAGKLARVPDSVSFDDAALLVAVIDALNCHERLRPEPGEAVAVIGVGAMGLGAIQTLRTRTSSDRHRRHRPARSAGARTGRRGGLPDRRPRRRRQRPAAVVDARRHRVRHGVDCSDWGISQALRIAAIGGRVALTGGGLLHLTSWDLVFRDLTVFGSKAGYQQEQALRLVEAGRLDLKAAVTHRWPLARAPEAFELLAGPGAAPTSAASCSRSTNPEFPVHEVESHVVAAVRTLTPESLPWEPLGSLTRKLLSKDPVT